MMVFIPNYPNLEIEGESKEVLLLGYYLLSPQDQKTMLEWVNSLEEGRYIIFCPHVGKVLRELSNLKEGQEYQVDVPLLTVKVRKEEGLFVFEDRTGPTWKVIKTANPKTGLLHIVTEVSE